MEATLITLQSSDATEFKVDKKVAEMSVTIKNIMEDLDDDLDIPLPLPNVTGEILGKIVEFCQHHVGDKPIEKDEKRTDDIAEWDADFCKVDQEELFEIILAANYLDIKPLLDLTCKTVANMIKGKTPEEIRRTFDIKNDFTPEEEEQVRKQNEWCEEK